MKIMAISDIHGHLADVEKKWKSCEACVIAGDVIPQRTGYHDFDFAVEWWNTELKSFCEQHPHTQFLIVPGNAELFLDDEVCDLKKWSVPEVLMAENATLLKSGAANWMGLKIYAYPWTAAEKLCGGFVRHGCDLKSKAEEIPRGLDLLILHSVHGMHKTICRVKPIRVFYGHDHTKTPMEEVKEGIRFMNVCVGDHESVYNDLYVTDILTRGV